MLPGKVGDPGRTGVDNRLFVNGWVWVLVTFEILVLQALQSLSDEVTEFQIKGACLSSAS